jgi:hypothetical protein
MIGSLNIRKVYLRIQLKYIFYVTKYGKKMLQNTPLRFEDIQVYGKECLQDTRKAGYNIGDLLNMPFLGGWCNGSPHNNDNDLQRMNMIGTVYTGSILHYYIQDRPLHETIPNIPRLIKSVEMYEEKHKQTFLTIYNEVQEKNILCVHLRSGDKEVNPKYIQLISQMSRLYDKTILISGIHLDEHYIDNQTKINNFVQTINQIMDNSKNVSVFLAEPDVHLVIMKVAKNMLLHTGGFSVLGSIVNKNNMFLTSLMDDIVTKHNWKTLVNNPYTFLSFGEPSKVFITFGSGEQNFVDAANRISDQAQKVNIFHRIFTFGKNDLINDLNFWMIHGDFIQNNKRGFGYFLWKPYLIKKVFDSLQENDTLLYCDCGNEIDVHKKSTLLEAYEMVKKDYLLGTYPAEYDPNNGNIPFLNEIHWTKQDLFNHFGIPKNHPLLFTNQRQANTLLMIKKEPIMKLVNEWYEIASIYRLLDDSPSIAPHFSEGLFHEHRHDQSIFSLLTKKNHLFSTTTLEKAICIKRNRSGISQL